MELQDFVVLEFQGDPHVCTYLGKKTTWEWQRKIVCHVLRCIICWTFKLVQPSCDITNADPDLNVSRHIASTFVRPQLVRTTKCHAQKQIKLHKSSSLDLFFKHSMKISCTVFFWRLPLVAGNFHPFKVGFIRRFLKFSIFELDENMVIYSQIGVHCGFWSERQSGWANLQYSWEQAEWRSFSSRIFVLCSHLSIVRFRGTELTKKWKLCNLLRHKLP